MAQGISVEKIEKLNLTNSEALNLKPVKLLNPLNF